MKIIQGEKTIIKSWCENPEQGAIDQMLNLAKLPFLAGHIAVMPDTHCGYGMPIGGVLATKSVVIPNAVGVDIGCGMCAVKTSLTDIDTETLKKILGGSKENHGGIRSEIPVGFNHQSKKQDVSFMPKEGSGFKMPIIEKEFESALKQIGTLGGGNHFIEIQKGSDGHIWIMIHSGSRNLGKQVCDYYKELAFKLNHKWYAEIPETGKNDYLGFFPIDSEEGQAYLREMNYAVAFALANRKLMMERICNIFAIEIYGTFTAIDDMKQHFEPMINIAHNYATMEHHFGTDMMIHRKGATLASEKTIGIIPGSQGSSSYIIKGKGNPESYNSCSHGAGRAMGRKQAIRELDFESEKKKLDDMKILHSVRGKNDLEEATGAYKNIETVMEEQKDLVEILVKLTPLAVVKG
jgi:tRNA-splicing ligase RtcB